MAMQQLILLLTLLVNNPGNPNIDRDLAVAIYSAKMDTFNEVTIEKSFASAVAYHHKHQAPANSERKADGFLALDSADRRSTVIDADFQTTADKHTYYISAANLLKKLRGMRVPILDNLVLVGEDGAPIKEIKLAELKAPPNGFLIRLYLVPQKPKTGADGKPLTPAEYEVATALTSTLIEIGDRDLVTRKLARRQSATTIGKAKSKWDIGAEAFLEHYDASGLIVEVEDQSGANDEVTPSQYAVVAHRTQHTGKIVRPLIKVPSPEAAEGDAENPEKEEEPAADETIVRKRMEPIEIAALEKEVTKDQRLMKSLKIDANLFIDKALRSKLDTDAPGEYECMINSQRPEESICKRGVMQNKVFQDFIVLNRPADAKAPLARFWVWDKHNHARTWEVRLGFGPVPAPSSPTIAPITERP
jgi:hypothetical protein